MTVRQSWQGPADYQIVVKGNLRNPWVDRFEDLIIEPSGGETILTGKALDQPALHGLLLRIRDLGLPLISISRVD
jgi:hypothetical protein